ncbi:MAG: hypothetical protein KDN20_16135 [Verrucomicrobiae bacterium]|nr:hypothetical protein [Verrucomicrobiae bacterium]
MKSPTPATLFLLAISLFLSSCGDRDSSTEGDGTTIVSPPPPAQAAPTNAVTLPPTGQITTSASTPSSPSTRQLTPEEQSRVINQMMTQMADRQAKALNNASVKVNGAWYYDGYSTLSPNPASEIPARMVAIDLTVQGHTPDFDPDDIEIVDGLTMVSYASDPHITFLKGTEEIIEKPQEIPMAPHATRMLLIYAFPKSSPKFTLVYWGQKLLKTPMTFEASGWGLPFPEKAE